MSTIDLPKVSRVTLVDLRRANVPVVLVALVVVLVAWASGLAGHAGEEARQQAARVEHQRQVAQRVGALAADWSVEQSFLDGSHHEAGAARIAAGATERAGLVANRAAALAAADAALATSAGKVDEARRGELTAAVAALAGSGSVFSRVAAATAEVSRLTGEVAGAETAWDAEQQRLAAVTTRGTVTPVSRAAARAGGSVQEVGEATLRSLPGNAGVTIHWDDPDLSGHLGAVWAGNTTYIMVNGTALAGNPRKAGDVVRHEIAHIYQGRLAAANGLSWSALGDLMSAAFGPGPQEKAADCVALRLGASWTYYTSSCGGADQQAWVDGLIGGHLP